MKLVEIHPKLPMRSKEATKNFYINKLGFQMAGGDFDGYLMLRRDEVEIHFFAFEALDPKENYGQVYVRVENIEELYQSLQLTGVVHPNGHLQVKPWKQLEFSVLDPDNNLLTFGQEG